MFSGSNFPGSIFSGNNFPESNFSGCSRCSGINRFFIPSLFF
ncbi:pentapeptide repeat-containing protein [Chitinophaga sp. LS1]